MPNAPADLEQELRAAERAAAAAAEAMNAPATQSKDAARTEPALDGEGWARVAAAWVLVLASSRAQAALLAARHAVVTGQLATGQAPSIEAGTRTGALFLALRAATHCLPSPSPEQAAVEAEWRRVDRAGTRGQGEGGRGLASEERRNVLGAVVDLCGTGLAPRLSAGDAVCAKQRAGSRGRPGLSRVARLSASASGQSLRAPLEHLLEDGGDHGDGWIGGAGGGETVTSALLASGGYSKAVVLRESVPASGNKGRGAAVHSSRGALSPRGLSSLSPGELALARGWQAGSPLAAGRGGTGATGGAGATGGTGARGAQSSTSTGSEFLNSAERFRIGASSSSSSSTSARSVVLAGSPLDRVDARRWLWGRVGAATASEEQEDGAALRRQAGLLLMEDRRLEGQGASAGNKGGGGAGNKGASAGNKRGHGATGGGDAGGARQDAGVLRRMALLADRRELVSISLGSVLGAGRPGRWDRALRACDECGVWGAMHRLLELGGWGLSRRTVKAIGSPSGGVKGGRAHSAAAGIAGSAGQADAANSASIPGATHGSLAEPASPPRGNVRRSSGRTPKPSPRARSGTGTAPSSSSSSSSSSGNTQGTGVGGPDAAGSHGSKPPVDRAPSQQLHALEPSPAETVAMLRKGPPLGVLPFFGLCAASGTCLG